MSLTWSKIPEDTFSRDVAHLKELANNGFLGSSHALKEFVSLLKGTLCPEISLYLVSRILETFLQFCLHLLENFSSVFLIYSQGEKLLLFFQCGTILFVKAIVNVIFGQCL